MKLLLFLSDAIIPLLTFYIVGMGLLNHQNIYDQFIKGAAEGLKTVIGILPTLIGLMVAVGILRASGLLDFLAEQLSVFTDLIHFPSELLPLALARRTCRPNPRRCTMRKWRSATPASPCTWCPAAPSRPRR